eukprot:1179465-Prorocentrum_minimum.AAC.22
MEDQDGQPKVWPTIESHLMTSHWLSVAPPSASFLSTSACNQGSTRSARTNQTQEARVYSHDGLIRHKKIYSRARHGRHGHCRIDRQDLIKPSYHWKIQSSRHILTDAAATYICPCRPLPAAVPTCDPPPAAAGAASRRTVWPPCNIFDHPPTMTKNGRKRLVTKLGGGRGRFVSVAAAPLYFFLCAGIHLFI